VSLYLVTHSAHYYPSGGVSDFRHITADADEAATWFEQECGEARGHGASVYLIVLNETGWSIRDSRSYEWEQA
jgi:hypothetical protein